MVDKKHSTFSLFGEISKWDLAAALFEKKQGRYVYVTVKRENAEVVYRLRVVSVESKDTTGELWSIKGYATLKEGMGMHEEFILMRFRTDEQKGSISFSN